MEVAMAMSLDQERILGILSENLNNPHPEVVASLNIARALKMEPARVRQVIKVLDHVGSVVTDLDGSHVLITSQGLQWLQQRSTFRP
jgi:hypothetical protein